MTRGRDVAAEISQALRAYQDRPHPALVGVQADAQAERSPTIPERAPSASAAAPRAPRYVMLASPRDRRAVAAIQLELARRGITQAECVQVADAEPLLMPTPAGAAQAGFALIFVSGAIVRSARLHAITSDLLAHGVLIIPVMLRTNPPLPPLLAQLQWVDFRPGIDRQRSRCDLLDALDAAGVPLASPTHALDGDLILARAMHDRSQPDWSVFQMHPEMRTVYRLYLGLHLFLAATAVFLLLATLLATVTGVLLTAEHGSGVMRLVLPIALALVGLPLFIAEARSCGRQLGRATACGRLARNAAVPEMIVVTSGGLVTHVVEHAGARQSEARSPGFTDHALPFASIRAIVRRRGYYMPIRLRCERWHGPTIDIGLPGQLVDVDAAADTIEQRWRDATQRIPPTPEVAPTTRRRGP